MTEEQFRDAYNDFFMMKNAINIKESVLDGECKELSRIGYFPKHLMEKTGLIRYAGKNGKTRIVIEYNNNTGNGWLRAVSEDAKHISTLTDHQEPRYHKDPM